ncbi:unnamed protein product [Allacma fusca]|uniref:Uncharacterized protein n=1 Tax=Allacma fusca TaxID=39272 RepID=A0A8J2LM23_9HEXA|nr:unnamed protein product [Allacma fusca]
MADEDVEIGKCKDEMRGHASKASSSEIINKAMRFCFLIIYEDFDLSQLETEVNFESIITSFFPKFWSKSAKDVAKNAVFKILKRDYSKDVPEFTALVPEMIAATETNFKKALKPGESIKDQNLLVKAFLTHRIYNVCNYVRYYVMCQKGGEPFE